MRTAPGTAPTPAAPPRRIWGEQRERRGQREGEGIDGFFGGSTQVQNQHRERHRFRLRLRPLAKFGVNKESGENSEGGCIGRL